MWCGAYFLSQARGNRTTETAWRTIAPPSIRKMSAGDEIDTKKLKKSLMLALKCLDKDNTGYLSPELLKHILATSAEAQMQQSEISSIFESCRFNDKGEALYGDLVDAIVGRLGQESQPDTLPGSSTAACVVETGRRFSESLLWRLLPLWYQEAGQRAWGRDAVPSYITSNASIARTYCHLFQAFVRDLQKRHLRQPGGGKPSRKPFDPRR